MAVSFGDNVRILSHQATDAASISGRLGCVYGETVPSISGASVLGELKEDYAINVFIDELQQDFWLDPSLVEFLDHGAGAEMRIEGSPYKAVRQADGSWLELQQLSDGSWVEVAGTILPKKPWWRIW